MSRSSNGDAKEGREANPKGINRLSRKLQRQIYLLKLTHYFRNFDMSSNIKLKCSNILALISPSPLQWWPICWWTRLSAIWRSPRLVHTLDIKPCQCLQCICIVLQRFKSTHLRSNPVGCSHTVALVFAFALFYMYRNHFGLHLTSNSICLDFVVLYFLHLFCA